MAEPANKKRSAPKRAFLNAAVFLLALPASAAVAEEAGALEVFDVHFTVITKNPAAHRAATSDQLKTEVDILNKYFVSADGKPVARFRFKSAALYDEIRDSRCGFIAFGDVGISSNSEKLAALFNACDDPRVRDPRAINFFVYDSQGPAGAPDYVGHGRNNSNHPFVLVDWERLNHASQAPEEHEMGHAFGLEHECAHRARPQTPTNIMTSAECGKGSGGMRNIGFNPQQIATMLGNAPKIQQNLAGK